MLTGGPAVTTHHSVHVWKITQTHTCMHAGFSARSADMGPTGSVHVCIQANISVADILSWRLNLDVEALHACSTGAAYQSV